MSDKLNIESDEPSYELYGLLSVVLLDVGVLYVLCGKSPQHFDLFSNAGLIVES